jgi:Flp pilus assembly pilin Flp
LKLLNPIKKLVLDESGLETVEWAIVGGLIVAGAAALFVLIGADVANGLTGLSATTSKIPAP